jgi:hypothetical protein
VIAPLSLTGTELSLNYQAPLSFSGSNLILGSQNIIKAKGYFTFNGTSNPTIGASSSLYNFSNIVRTAVGTYTVTFDSQITNVIFTGGFLFDGNQGNGQGNAVWVSWQSISSTTSSPYTIQLKAYINTSGSPFDLYGGLGYSFIGI